MHAYTRRELIKAATALAAGLGLDACHAEAVVEGLQRLASKQGRVIWLQGMSCTGCSVSLLNAEYPGAFEILTEVISLVYHQTLSAAQGGQTAELTAKLRAEKGYILVLEGAIPADMPEACVIGGKPLTELLPDLLRNADAVVAAGTCAAFGGIPAAEGSPVRALSLREFMTAKGIPTEGRLINCPGCPTHPHSLVGTLGYVAAKGYPPVDAKLLTPKAFYGCSVHDECPRFHQYEKRIFAEKFGDEGCLFKLGCLGPLSHTVCPRRQWNGGVNWCIRAGAPCVACTSENFAKHKSFAFYRKGEQYSAVAVNDQARMH